MSIKHIVAGASALIIFPANAVYCEEVATCSIIGLNNEATVSYISVYHQFNWYDHFSIEANSPVKISLSNISTISEPSNITTNTNPMATIRHERLRIPTMLSWAYKTSGSPAADAQNLVGTSDSYRLRGYVRGLSVPGTYSYSITINCLL